MMKPIDLGSGISLIDVFDLGKENRTGTYVIHEEELTLIETSASPSIPYLLKGLEALEIDPADVKYIIVTHIHLDHSGGAGLLLEKCPNAQIIVHPKGKRHLADPSRLIQGARAVYGDQFDELFHPILPVPEDRLVSKEDGGTLQIGENRILTFLDTPGHANHHFSIYDPYSAGIFTGDTVGVYYSEILSEGLEFYLPSTSPNQFNPQAMLAAADRMEGLNIDRIYFGHYGMSENPGLVFKQLRYWLPIFVDTGRSIMEEHKDASFDEKTIYISTALFEKVRAYLTEHNVVISQEFRETIELDLTVCAMGIVDYFGKRK
ncbi:MAG TPA: MBL fold metallo-hydrolase [Bacillus sp. (in: firmicutes)]|nr:MBL fold metallo-hydrolase [Bacillus sp. (in: firmicutes)]